MLNLSSCWKTRRSFRVCGSLHGNLYTCATWSSVPARVANFFLTKKKIKMESLYFIEILYVVGERGVKNKQPTDTSLWNVFAQCLLLLKMVSYDWNLIQHPWVVIGDNSLQIGQGTQRNQVTVRGSRGSWSSTDLGCCHYSFFTDRKEKYVLTTQQSVLVFCHDAQCQSKESSQIWLYISHTSSGTNPVCQLPLLAKLYWKFSESTARVCPTSRLCLLLVQEHGAVLRGTYNLLLWQKCHLTG